jgi:hypothetical protein
VAEDIGALVARVVADTEQFRSEMSRLTGQIQSNTARMNRSLASINQTTKGLGVSFASLRSIAGAFGVALSTRFFARFIADALDAKNMTEAQIQSFRGAIEAINTWKAATQDAARIIGSTLSPALEASASVIDRFNAAFLDIGSQSAKRQIQLLQALIEQVKASTIDLDGQFHELSQQQLADIAALEKKIKDLKAQQFTGGPAGFIGPTRSMAEDLTEASVPVEALLKKFPSFNPAQGLAPLEFPDFKKLFDTTGLDKQLQEQEDLFQKMRDNEIANIEAVARANDEANKKMIESAREAAMEEFSVRETLMTNIAGLFAVLGEKHRGAAIAALAIEKALAIQQTLIQGQQAAAQVLAWGQVAAMRMLAALGPLGVAPAAAIEAKAVAEAAAIKGMSIASAAIIGATGIAEALQISHGGSGSGASNFGSIANPVATTGSASNSAAQTVAQRSAVQVIFQGDVFNFQDAVKKIGAELRDLVDNKDVVIIGPGSRQSLLLGG